MKVVTRFFDLVLYTSVFTACCAMGLCMATEKLINGGIPEFLTPLHLLVFGSVLFVYNTPRLIPKPYGRERKANPNRVWYQLSFFTGMALAAAGLYRMPVKMFVISGALSVFAFAYFLPVLPFRDKKRLRDYGWIKIAVLAGVWTVSTSVLPIIYYGKNIADYPVELLLRLVFIFTLCVVFDIRDVRSDRRNNIDTLPHKVGLRNSYRLINTTLVLFVALSVVQYMRYPSGIRLAGAFITAAIAKGVIRYLRKYPSERAYSILADGVMIVYAVTVLI